MNKRLRKTKHKGEYAEWGRHLIAIRNTKLAADAFHDAFIVEAIEGNECYCGGSLSDDRVDVIVELGKMSEDPNGKFTKITTWLDARSDIEKWRAGPLFDLWYGGYEDVDTSSEQWFGG